MDNNARIAIIGAGAAGLTAADTLKRKGYTNVTVLEKSERAGGKCSSLEYNNQWYELGAGVLSYANRTALRLATEYNVPTQRAQFGQSILLDALSGKELGKKSLQENIRLIRQALITYRGLCKRYTYTAQPGLKNIEPELCVPFSEFAKEHHIGELARELSLFFTGFGYDYFDNISAAYVLKYYSWEILKGFLSRKMYTFPGGIQHLWTAVTRGQNVVYNTNIEKIERTESEVRITTPAGVHTYDALIVTSPLDEFVHYADARAEEKELFSKIIYCDYRTYACIIKNFPKKSGYIPGNYSDERAGHPVFWYHRHADSPLYMFYILGDWKMSDKDVLTNINAVAESFGGSVESLHTVSRWKYFPHVGPEEMKNGYFDALEALQGNQHTYYAGELLNFSTVGLTAEYAEDLVNRFF